MTVLSRGARTRRGGRRPGWLLLTVLLVLAIAASSALVFTDRVELLKLAVILALWAAVVAAFVSVIYRRQSDIDQAKARDLKLVYDLQLDREISARREYELTVESHLRRELSSELRAQAAEDVAALRAELAALRTNLEILFDADLSQRPALESDRAYSEWVRANETAKPAKPGRVASSRITSVRADDENTRTAESPIIDVPEEPLTPQPSQRQNDRQKEEDRRRGSHRRASEETGWIPPVRAEERPQEPLEERPQPEPVPRQRPRPARLQPQPVQQEPEPIPATEPPQPPVRHAATPQQQQPSPVPVSPLPGPPPPVTPAAAADRRSDEWKPVEPAGRWLPPGVPGSNWISDTSMPPPENGHSAPATPMTPQAPPATPPERRGRHSGTADPVAEQQEARRSRHSSDADAAAQSAAQAAAPRLQTSAPPAPRHRSPDDVDAPPTGGQSVADLLGRLESGGGGGRRRRED